MKREKRKVKECYLLLAPFNEKFDVLLAFSRLSVRISFKNEDNGGAPPKEVGRDRSQLCSNRVPPTLELEKKTEDAEELPTQCGSDGKRKETPGGRPMHEIRIEGSRALKPTNVSQLRDNDRHDY